MSRWEVEFSVTELKEALRCWAYNGHQKLAEIVAPSSLPHNNEIKDTLSREYRKRKKLY